jgi:AcrR family transcriptional regulator
MTKSTEVPPARPRRKSGGFPPARTEEILDAATELFAEHGYSDAVTAALAERLQVGKGTLYRYFPSKRDLFLAAADRVMRRLREWVDKQTSDIIDPIARIRESLFAFLAFFEEHPKYAELLIQERALFKDRAKPTYQVHREANAVRWHETYRALIAEGRVRDVPVERIIDVFSDLAYGTVFTNYYTGRRKPLEAQARDILDVVFHGILTEPEGRRQAGGVRP